MHDVAQLVSIDVKLALDWDNLTLLCADKSIDAIVLLPSKIMSTRVGRFDLKAIETYYHI
jgi:hypothetical protein